MTRIILIILIFTLSCDDPAIEGCTSPTACNFDPNATKADGSCIQPEFCDNWCPDFDNQGNETTIDYQRMLQIVKSFGYNGYIGVEYEGNRLSEVEGIKATSDLLIKTGKSI